MKKIDFGKMKIYSGIAKRTCVVKDMREDFADVLCSKAAGVAALVLAQKIYKSDEDTEYDDREVELIKAVAMTCTPDFMISFFTAIGEELNLDNI